MEQEIFEFICGIFQTVVEGDWVGPIARSLIVSEVRKQGEKVVKALKEQKAKSAKQDDPPEKP